MGEWHGLRPSRTWGTRAQSMGPTARVWALAVARPWANHGADGHCRSRVIRPSGRQVSLHVLLSLLQPKKRR